MLKPVVFRHLGLDHDTLRLISPKTKKRKRCELTLTNCVFWAICLVASCTVCRGSRAKYAVVDSCTWYLLLG